VSRRPQGRSAAFVCGATGEQALRTRAKVGAGSLAALIHHDLGRILQPQGRKSKMSQ